MSIQVNSKSPDSIQYDPNFRQTVPVNLKKVISNPLGRTEHVNEDEPWAGSSNGLGEESPIACSDLSKPT
jgi:hypothetical protein